MRKADLDNYVYDFSSAGTGTDSTPLGDSRVMVTGKYEDFVAEMKLMCRIVEEKRARIAGGRLKKGSGYLSRLEPVSAGKENSASSKFKARIMGTGAGCEYTVARGKEGYSYLNAMFCPSKVVSGQNLVNGAGTEEGKLRLEGVKRFVSKNSGFARDPESVSDFEAMALAPLAYLLKEARRFGMGQLASKTFRQATVPSLSSDELRRKVAEGNVSVSSLTYAVYLDVGGQDREIILNYIHGGLQYPLFGGVGSRVTVEQLLGVKSQSFGTRTVEGKVGEVFTGVGGLLVEKINPSDRSSDAKCMMYLKDREVQDKANLPGNSGNAETMRNKPNSREASDARTKIRADITLTGEILRGFLSVAFRASQLLPNLKAYYSKSNPSDKLMNHSVRSDELTRDDLTVYRLAPLLSEDRVRNAMIRHCMRQLNIGLLFRIRSWEEISSIDIQEGGGKDSLPPGSKDLFHQWLKPAESKMMAINAVKKNKKVSPEELTMVIRGALSTYPVFLNRGKCPLRIFDRTREYLLNNYEIDIMTPSDVYEGLYAYLLQSTRTFAENRYVRDQGNIRTAIEDKNSEAAKKVISIMENSEKSAEAFLANVEEAQLSFPVPRAIPDVKEKRKLLLRHLTPKYG